MGPQFKHARLLRRGDVSFNTSFKFAPTPEHMDDFDMVASIEAGFQLYIKRANDQAEAERKIDPLRDQITHLLLTQRKVNFIPNLTTPERDALRALIVTKPLFLHALISQTRSFFSTKTFTWPNALSTCSTHLPLILDRDGNPDLGIIHIFEDELNRRLRALHAEGKISDTFLRRSLSHGGWLSKFYLVPKIHKVKNIKALTSEQIRAILPFRPIVAAPGTPSYPLQRSLVPILQSLTGLYPLRTVLRDTFDFATRIREWRDQHTIPPTHSLVSYDVDTMYTSTPVNECLEVIKERAQLVHARISTDFGLSVETLIELLRLCTTVLFISPSGLVYRQNDGFPMGGPISGPSCQIYVEKIEQRALLAPPVPPPLFWVRYVDDAFSIIHKEHAEEFRLTLNQCDDAARIHWTYELESSSCLPFLDCLLVHKPDGKIRIDLYRKPSANRRFIPYDSAHCLQHRLAVISAFLTRISRICDPENVDANRRWLHEVAILNGIPEHVTRQQFRRFDTRVTTPRRTPPSTTSTIPPPIRVSIPYYPNITEQIRKLLLGVVDVVSKPRTLGSLLSNRAKFPVEARFKQAPVYCAVCSSCNKKYFGESEASVHRRFSSGHWPAIRSARVTASALAQHEATHPGHLINPTVTVLFNEPQYHKRLILEALVGRAEDSASSMNFDWEASQDTGNPSDIGLRRSGRLAPIPAQWLFLLRGSPAQQSIHRRLPPPETIDPVLRWVCTTIPNLSTPLNLANIIHPICLCRDMQHLTRRDLGLLKALHITSERFGNCPFARCRFCCGVHCLQSSTTCPYHRVPAHVMKKYAESIPSNAPSEPVACRRCGLLIRRVAPFRCSGPCGRAWHPGCIPPAQRADRNVWKCKICLSVVNVPMTHTSLSLPPLPLSPPASPTLPPPTTSPPSNQPCSSIPLHPSIPLSPLPPSPSTSSHFFSPFPSHSSPLSLPPPSSPPCPTLPPPFPPSPSPSCNTPSPTPRPPIFPFPSLPRKRSRSLPHPPFPPTLSPLY